MVPASLSPLLPGARTKPAAANFRFPPQSSVQRSRWLPLLIPTPTCTSGFLKIDMFVSRLTLCHLEHHLLLWTCWTYATGQGPA